MRALKVEDNNQSLYLTQLISKSQFRSNSRPNSPSHLALTPNAVTRLVDTNIVASYKLHD